MFPRLCRSTFVLFCTLLAAAFAAPASFAAAPPKTLTVLVQGAGSVTIDPDNGPYPRGTPVTMTALPDAGWTFDHWEGPTIDGSTSNPQVISMYNNYTVTAVFATPTGVDIHRKRDLIVEVVDGGLSPVADVEVSLNLRQRAFPFGTAVTASLLTNSKYRSFVRQHSPTWWDWAVHGNEAKWYTNEATQGFVNYQDADAMASLLTGWGFKLRGHTLFWAVQDNVQQWVQDLTDPVDLQAAVDDRLGAVDHFLGAFEHWDVNNEMVHGTFFQDRLGAGIRKYMHDEASFRDPGVLITINDYNVIAGGWQHQEYKDLVVQLESEGVQIDILGVQCHMTTDDTVAEINQRLDSIAELGYPIWVTEFDVAIADATARAQYVEDFYRTVFAHPSVEGVMMWGFWAGDHWRGADAALVDMDWTVNEAGQRYASLMAEWWTDELGLTDGAGETTFNGFHGTYDVTLTPNGGTPEVHTVALSGGSGAEVVQLVLGSGAAPDEQAPSPDPSTWDVPPAAVGAGAISMLATEATDATGVEYYFANVTDPSHDSGWLDTPFFTDTGLSVGVQYTYQVKTRDTAVFPNEGAWSATASASTSSDPNLFLNGGFEYGYPDGWSGFGGASILVTNAVAADGQFSCFVGNRSETWKGAIQNLTSQVSAGKTYAVSAKFLIADGSTQPVALTVKQTDASGTNYYGIASGEASGSTFTEITGSFTLSVTGSLSELSVFTEGPAVGVDLYVDSLTFREVGAPVCGDGTCNGTETQCSCAADCGAPPATELLCGNSADDDCDGNTDCADSDCSAAPECQSACDGDGTCEAGEDCNNCSSDCAGVSAGKPSNRYCCGNGIPESAEGNGSICDGNY